MSAVPKTGSANEPFSFFACGTLADKRGFEYVSLGPRALPRDAGGALDMSPEASSAVSHMFSRVKIDGRPFVRYVRYVRIRPSDTQANRGAYIAAGFLLNEMQTLHELAVAVEHVARVFQDLTARLRPDRSFDPEFSLRAYVPPARNAFGDSNAEVSPLLLTDLAMQALQSKGEFRKDSQHYWFDAASLAAAGSEDQMMTYLGPERTADAEYVDPNRLRRLAEKTLLAYQHISQITDRWQREVDENQQRAATLQKSAAKLKPLIDEVSASQQMLQSIAAPPPQAPAHPQSRMDAFAEYGPEQPTSAAPAAPIALVDEPPATSPYGVQRERPPSEDPYEAAAAIQQRQSRARGGAPVRPAEFNSKWLITGAVAAVGLLLALGALTFFQGTPLREASPVQSTTTSPSANGLEGYPDTAPAAENSVEKERAALDVELGTDETTESP